MMKSEKITWHGKTFYTNKEYTVRKMGVKTLLNVVSNTCNYDSMFDTKRVKKVWKEFTDYNEFTKFFHSLDKVGRQNLFGDNNSSKYWALNNRVFQQFCSFRFLHDKKITFFIRDKFEWPAGYFGDNYECWHSSAANIPPAWEYIGAKWIVFYADGYPIARAGILPDKLNHGVDFFVKNGVKVLKGNPAMIFDLYDNDNYPPVTHQYVIAALLKSTNHIYIMPNPGTFRINQGTGYNKKSFPAYTCNSAVVVDTSKYTLSEIHNAVTHINFNVYAPAWIVTKDVLDKFKLLCSDISGSYYVLCHKDDGWDVDSEGHFHPVNRELYPYRPDVTEVSIDDYNRYYGIGEYDDDYDDYDDDDYDGEDDWDD